MKTEVPAVRIMPDGRMNRRNAATYLGYKPKTLAMWAIQGKGPAFVKIHGRAFYYQKILDAFAKGEQASAA